MCKQDANNPDELTCHALRSSSCPKFIESLAKFEPEQHLIGDVSLETTWVVFPVGFTWKQLNCIVGSMDQESSQQLQMWFSEHFFTPKLAGLIVTPIVSATVEQKWREKMSEKPHSIRLLRWFNFSQSGSRKNNRKTFEGASVEPTM